jgi:hypothetical protein
VEEARIVSMPRERIIDANDYAHLGTRVRELQLPFAARHRRCDQRPGPGVVVLAEVDFEPLDEETRRRLFVGMTRAQLALEVVLSRAAEVALGGALAQVCAP